MRILDKKLNALEEFKKRLLESEVKDYIGKIILFGSVNDGKPKRDSDVDVLVFGTDHLQEISETCSDIAFDVVMDRGEVIQPLVHCLDELRMPQSYFLYDTVRGGKEVYSLEEKILRQREAQGYLELAKDFWEGAESSLGSGHVRLAVDGAYNAVKLAAKGLLVSEVGRLPSSHGGIVSLFSKVYVRGGLVPEIMGRNFNKALEMRARARYEPHAVIRQEDAEKILALAQEFIKVLEEKLSKEQEEETG